MSNAAEQADLKPRGRRARRGAGGKLALTIDELVEDTGTGRSTIYEEIRCGKLRAKKLGRRTIVLTDDAADWLERLPDYPTVPDE